MPEWLVGQLTTTANLETLGQGGAGPRGHNKEGKRMEKVDLHSKHTGKWVKHGHLTNKHRGFVVD
jgi:hypothetical protein